MSIIKSIYIKYLSDNNKNNKDQNKKKEYQRKNIANIYKKEYIPIIQT